MGSLSLPMDATPLDMTPAPALTQLYQRYSDAVYFTALRVTGNRADAEDALQTVFLRLMRHGQRLDPAGTERYLRRAATNAALDILRRAATRSEAQLNDTVPHAAREGPTLLKERLRRAIGRLEPRDAELFVLRYVEGWSNGELAELLGVEKNNIAVRLHRIRQSLQAELER